MQTTCEHIKSGNIHSYSNGLDIYCVKCIWSINKKPTEIFLEELNPKYEEISWGEILAKDIINKHNLNKEEESHYRRIMKYSNYPIFIDSDYRVIDGCHRLARAYMKKQLTIKCIIVTYEEINFARF